MNSEILKKYDTLLTERSFLPDPDCDKFGPAGSCWQLSPELGGGGMLSSEVQPPEKSGTIRLPKCIM